MSKVSVRQAAWLTGKSKETINTAANQGIISFSLNGRNHKEIDIAELERVYPIVRPIGGMDQGQAESVRNHQVPDSEPSGLRQEVAVLRERVQGLSNERDFLKTERERERRQLEEEIENLRDSLKAAQDNHGKAMLLLTHTRAPEAAATAGADKLATLEQGVLVLQKQNRAIARELRRQKQGFWRRLFGGGEPPVVSEKKPQS